MEKLCLTETGFVKISLFSSFLFASLSSKTKTVLWNSSLFPQAVNHILTFYLCENAVLSLGMLQ